MMLDDRKEDILLLSNKRHSIVCDLGWYPALAANGRYKLLIVKGEEWEKPLLTFESFDTEEIREKLEAVLVQFNEPGESRP